MTEPTPSSLTVLPAKRSRILELDGLRAFAALAIFIYHVKKIPLLWMGVDLFFVLSGFLITGILLDRKEAGLPYFSYFWERRARRVLPPYTLLLVVSSIVVGTAWFKHWYWFAFFAANIGAALRHIPEGGLLVLWSLAVEEQFYLIWPFVVLYTSRRTLFYVGVGAMIGAPLLRALAADWFTSFWPIYVLTPFRMDTLCCGALIALIWRSRQEWIRRYYWLALGAVPLVCAILVWMSTKPHLRTAANNPVANASVFSLVLILVAAIVWVALDGRGPIGQLLRFGPLRFVGTLSYSIYLIHVTVLYYLKPRIDNFALYVAVSFAITMAYAAASWFGFEKRLIQHSNPKKS